MTSWPRGAPRPGDRAELSRKVEAADIELFTRISGDRNPLHYDEGAARASRFGEIIVQGGVTSAILNAVVAERLPATVLVFVAGMIPTIGEAPDDWWEHVGFTAAVREQAEKELGRLEREEPTRAPEERPVVEA
jgi:hypothetical protein